MVRLYMKDYFTKKWTPVAGKFWGCKGAQINHYSRICMSDSIDGSGEVCKEVKPGKITEFPGGYKVVGIRTYIPPRGEPGVTRETWAEVTITRPAIVPTPAPIVPTPPAIVPTPPAVVRTIPVEILIPNKVTGYTTYTFDVKIPEVEIPEVEIPEPICIEGYKRRTTCPDGTVIVTHICKKDPTTGLTQWYPTGEPCPPPELGKVAKILVNGELRAFEGMDVTITAGVMCGATPSHGEPAILLIDGKEIDRKNTSQGFVSFKWTATAEPARTHKVVVSIPKSEQCPRYGGARDSKTITVSRMVPAIRERLWLEREQYRSRLEALREERRLIREMSRWARIPARRDLVTIPVIPPTEIIPTPPVVEPKKPPFEPPPPLVTIPVMPQPGIIDIPSIPAPPLTEYPIHISIDGVFKGPPPLQIEVTPGTHTVKAELKNFIPLHRTVILTEGQTLQITDLAFI